MLVVTAHAEQHDKRSLCSGNLHGMGIRGLVFRVSDGEDIGEKTGVVFLGCAAGKNRIGDDDVDERGEGLDAHFEKLRPQPQKSQK